MKLYTYEIQTNKVQEFINIDSYVMDAVSKSTVKDGRILIFCTHTTAGITINENADPDVVIDMIMALNKTFPINGDYKHYEGNSHAHLKSSFVGVDQNLIIHDGKPILGIWQSAYFCEFDGPRKRMIYIQIDG